MSSGLPQRDGAHVNESRLQGEERTCSFPLYIQLICIVLSLPQLQLPPRAKLGSFFENNNLFWASQTRRGPVRGRRRETDRERGSEEGRKRGWGRGDRERGGW